MAGNNAYGITCTVSRYSWQKHTRQTMYV